MCNPKLLAENICKSFIESKEKSKTLTLVKLDNTRLACTITIVPGKTTSDEIVENSCLFSELIDICNGKLSNQIGFCGTSGSCIKLQAKTAA